MSASFLQAASVDEALAALDAGARPIAGGTDLVVGARQGKAPLPAALVAIDRLDDELGSISDNPDGSLTIGSLVNHLRLMSEPLVVERATALADGAALIGSPATRNVGTIGGNVMNASPAMDTGAALAVLGATVHLRSASGPDRILELDELWTGPGTTTARPDELCVGLSLPARPPRSGSAYLRLEYRRAMEIAVVGAAASISLSADNLVETVSIALTAVAPTILAVEGTAALAGRAVDTNLLDQVAALASEQARPIADLRASERYRRHTVGVMARRALEAAAERAQGIKLGVPVNRNKGIGVSL